MLNNFKTDHVVSSTQRILATTPWKLGVLDVYLTEPQVKGGGALSHTTRLGEATALEMENTEHGSGMESPEISSIDVDRSGSAG
jgi:hypothetical protein